jgi:HlyD family secretion protein
MGKRRMVILLAVIVIIVGGFVYYFYKNGLDHGLTASGTIEVTDVTVSSKVVARVLEVKVGEGSQVKLGDILALLDPSELQQALNSAQAKYQIAKDDFARNQQLFADRMISPQQFDVSASALEVAKAAFDTAQLQLDNAVIRAPISGVILVKAIEPGELATVGTPIVTMADLSVVKLTVYLAEQNVGKVNLGEAVAVSVDSYPDQKFLGKITYISDQAEFTPKSIQTKEERTTQVFGVKIEIPNPDQKLKPGMPADAEFSAFGGQ